MTESDYPFVDEHEFNCSYVLSTRIRRDRNKEKPRMTCYEKLKSEHPDWDEKTLYEYTLRMCPSYLDWLEDPKDCYNGIADYQCSECWNREMEENI